MFNIRRFLWSEPLSEHFHAGPKVLLLELLTEKICDGIQRIYFLLKISDDSYCADG